MYRIMLLDDEPILLDGLARLTPWEKYGFTLVATASHGFEGLEKALDYQPDAVITDVRMRLMDGLTFIEKLRELNSEIEVAVMSAYDLFEYAHRAFSLGVDDYLLKPIKPEDMARTLNTLRGRIDEKRSLETLLSRTQIYEAQRGAELRTFARKSVMRGDCSSDNLRYAALPEEAKAGPLRVIMLRDNTEENRRLVSIPIEKVFADAFGERALFSAVFDDGTVGLVARGDQEKLSILTEEGLRRVRGATRATLTATIGDEAGSLAELGASYDSAQRQMQAACLMGVVGIARPDTGFGEGYPHDLEYALISRLATGEIDLEPAWGEAFLRRMRLRPEAWQPSARLLFLRVLQRLIGMNSAMLNQYSFWQTRLEQVLTLPQERSYGEYLSLLEELLGGREGREEGALQDYMARLTDQAKSFAMERLGDSALGIRAAAEQLHLSAPYLGRIFKRVTGQTYSDYLNDIRVARARVMLRDPDMKVGTIAVELGFSNQSYFQVVFKRKTGLTPGEYRARSQDEGAM